MKRRSFLKHSAVGLGAGVFAAAIPASCACNGQHPNAPLLFDTVDPTPPSSDVPLITPWRTVALDPDYGGLWVVAGDVDGNGALIWEHSGHHFESINVGRVIPGRDSLQLVVDIDHRPRGEAPLWVFDEDGAHLGQIMTHYCRSHTLLDWTGNGYDNIVIGSVRGLFDHQGERIGTFDAPGASHVHIGDMTGDGLPDIILYSDTAVYIFRNEHGTQPDTPPPLGTGLNVTLY